MDHSVENIGNYISDRVTIKVKVADEEYHDLVIDWSDKGDQVDAEQQVLRQISSITGAPYDSIRFVFLFGPPMANSLDSFPIANKDHQLNKNVNHGNWFTKEYCSGMINDGDCFVIQTCLDFTDDCFSLSISLIDPVLINENDCNIEYCHYSNTRAFINRQIAIATNTGLVMEIRSKLAELPNNGSETIPEFVQRMKIFRDLDIKPFIKVQWCHIIRLSLQDRIIANPHYSRIRG